MRQKALQHMVQQRRRFCVRSRRSDARTVGSGSGGRLISEELGWRRSSDTCALAAGRHNGQRGRRKGSSTAEGKFTASP